MFTMWRNGSYAWFPKTQLDVSSEERDGKGMVRTCKDWIQTLARKYLLWIIRSVLLTTILELFLLGLRYGQPRSSARMRVSCDATVVLPYDKTETTLRHTMILLPNMQKHRNTTKQIQSRLPTPTYFFLGIIFLNHRPMAHQQKDGLPPVFLLPWLHNYYRIWVLLQSPGGLTTHIHGPKKSSFPCLISWWKKMWSMNCLYVSLCPFHFFAPFLFRFFVELTQTFTNFRKQTIDIVHNILLYSGRSCFLQVEHGIHFFTGRRVVDCYGCICQVADIYFQKGTTSTP